MTPATTATLAAEHERLGRYIHGHFKRKLTFEDAADAASEAIAEADRATTPIQDREKWLRRAAWRNALDQIRKIEGEGQTPRERPAGLGDDVHRLPSAETTEGTLIAAALHDADTRALAKAAEALKPDEHRVLHLRYIDGLDVPIIMELIGCSRHHYDNLHKRGLRKLRDALVAPATTSACREARGLILASALGGLTDDDAVRRDAHVESCLACRAFSKRRDGLIAAMPLPAVPALLSRVAAFFAGGAAPVKVAALCAAVAPIAAPVIEHDMGRPPHDDRRRATTAATRARPVARIITTTTAVVVTPTRTTATTSHVSKSRTRKSIKSHVSSASRAAKASPFLPESVAAPRGPDPVAVAATAKPQPKPSSAPASGSSSFADEFTP